MTEEEDNAVAVEQLRSAIKLSGLSARKFAEKKLVRDERTLRRWMNGNNPIPASVRVWVRAYLAKGRP